MNLDLEQWIGTISLWGGLAVPVAAFLVVIFKKTILEWISERIAFSFRERLSSLESDLRSKEDRISQIHSNVLSFVSGRRRLVEEKQIAAAEVIWNYVIDVDSILGGVEGWKFLKFNNICDNIEKDEKIRQFIETIGPKMTSLEHYEKHRNIELVSPFVDEDTLNIYHSYMTIIMLVIVTREFLISGIDPREHLTYDDAKKDLRLRLPDPEFKASLAQDADTLMMVGALRPLRARLYQRVRVNLLGESAFKEAAMAAVDVLYAVDEAEAIRAIKSQRPELFQP